MTEQLVRKVVEAVYFTDDDGKAINTHEPRLFTPEEESVMQLWKNVLNDDDAIQMINISYDMFTKAEILTEENMSLTNTKEWVEKHQKTAWTTMRNAMIQNDANVTTEAESCLHLLCYMICLCAVLKRLQGLTLVHEDRWLVLLVEHVWSILLKETSLSCRNFKLLPRQGFFEQLMKQLGCSSSATGFSQLFSWIFKSIETGLFGTKDTNEKK